jgi:hypothetical protein
MKPLQVQPRFLAKLIVYPIAEQIGGNAIDQLGDEREGGERRITAAPA